jgi:hypothetical protein
MAISRMGGAQVSTAAASAAESLTQVGRASSYERQLEAYSKKLEKGLPGWVSKIPGITE